MPGSFQLRQRAGVKTDRINRIEERIAADHADAAALRRAAEVHGDVPIEVAVAHIEIAFKAAHCAIGGGLEDVGPGVRVEVEADAVEPDRAPGPGVDQRSTIGGRNERIVYADAERTLAWRPQSRRVEGVLGLREQVRSLRVQEVGFEEQPDIILKVEMAGAHEHHALNRNHPFLEVVIGVKAFAAGEENRAGADPHARIEHRQAAVAAKGQDIAPAVCKDVDAKTGQRKATCRRRNIAIGALENVKLAFRPIDDALAVRTEAVRPVSQTGYVVPNRALLVFVFDSCGDVAAAVGEVGAENG